METKASGVIRGIVNFLKTDDVFRNKGVSLFHQIKFVGIEEGHRQMQEWSHDLWYAMDAKAWLNLSAYDELAIEGDFATYCFANCAFTAIAVYFTDY